MKPWIVLLSLTLLPGCAWLGQESRRPPAEERPAPLNEALRAELLAMSEVDQEARSQMNGERMDIVDRKHTARMKTIVAELGWPGRSLVGEDGADAAWLLVQHADQDLTFQAECLALLEAAAHRGEASLRQAAYLSDRVRVNRREPQRYGTQFVVAGGELVPHPIVDIAGLEARRAEAGLEPFSEYEARLKKTVAAHQEAPIKAPALREELMAMAEAGQAAMSADFEAYLVSPGVAARVSRLRAIVEAHGWPGSSMVGPDGDQAMFGLLREVANDPAFLERCLTALQAAHAQGNTPGSHVAELTDRLLVEAQKPQRYGTQFTFIEGEVGPHPIEDPDYVDQRRAEMGLEPLADKLQRMRRLNPKRDAE